MCRFTALTPELLKYAALLQNTIGFRTTRNAEVGGRASNAPGAKELHQLLQGNIALQQPLQSPA